MAARPSPLHTCELCGQEGMAEEDLRSHMRLEHVEGSPACPFCDLADLSHSEMVSCNFRKRKLDNEVNVSV